MRGERHVSEVRPNYFHFLIHALATSIAGTEVRAQENQTPWHWPPGVPESSLSHNAFTFFFKKKNLECIDVTLSISYVEFWKDWIRNERDSRTDRREGST